MQDLERALEAVLFAVGEPIPDSRLMQVLCCGEEQLEQAAHSLQNQLSFEQHGLRLLRLEDSWQLCTCADLADCVTMALETRKPARLSAAALETLAVIAYYQPTTKVYVEQLRGVDSSYSVSSLVRRELIEECGRLEVPGRPILYRTTPGFLRVFGLQSLQELPPLEQLASAAGLLQAEKEETSDDSADNHSGDSAPDPAAPAPPGDSAGDLVDSGGGAGPV